MPITVHPLHPDLAAEVRGADLTQPVDAATLDAIRDALDRHSVLVFRDQRLDDDAQVAFSRRFGRLEKTRKGAVGEGSELVILTNLDDAGRVRPPTDSQMFHSRANQLWHSDASFRPVPAHASVLSGRRVATRGGETEYASTRVGYAALDEVTRRRVDGLGAIHHFAHSRSLIEPGRLDPAERDHLPPVRHPLVRRHSRTGEPALFVGSHVRELIGMPLAEGRAIVDSLLEHITREERVFTHRWQPFDLVIWDNAAVVHRGRPWDAAEPRHLVRATVADDAYRAGSLVAA